jgi:hypothetical protein
VLPATYRLATYLSFALHMHQERSLLEAKIEEAESRIEIALE